MSLEELLIPGIGSAIVLSLIQISPVKINPLSALMGFWKWIWRGFCKSLTAPVLAELEELKKAQREQAEILSKHITEADTEKADRMRDRILGFSEKIRLGNEYTHERWANVMLDITRYESFCAEHKNYPNGLAVAAIEHIRSEYQRRLPINDFA